MKFIFFFAVFFLFLILVQYWQLIKLLLLNPIHKYKYYPCSPDEIPKPMRKQLKMAISELQNLGFKTVHFQKHEEIYFALKRPIYTAVLYQPEHNIYVEVENPMNPDAIQPFRSTFLSYYDTKIVIGYYAEAYSVIEGYKGHHCVDHTQTDQKLRLKCFLQYLSSYENENGLGPRQKQSIQTYINRNNTSASEYIDFLEGQDLVKQNKDGAYAFKFFAAIKIASKIKKGSSEIAKKELEDKALLSNHPDYLLAPEVNAYYRLDKIINHNTFNKWVKTILFILSVLAFSVLFGSFISYSFVLFLLPVLFFHELGHYLAMKLFGYHDLQILFLPFGAAVLGKEKNISVLKKVVVSLAGPVPGIIVAMLIGWGVPDVLETEWLYELALILLIINYFNLLPFMPLDGGQIINQVLFGRYPIAQFVFSVVSVIAFIFFAYYFDDYILKTISIFLALGLIGQFSNTKILYSLRNIVYSNKTNLIAKVFKHLESQPIRFQQKFQKVQAVVPSLTQAKAKIHEIFLGLLLYFATLFAPLYVLNVYTNGALMMVFNYQIGNDLYDDEQWTIQYWQEKINDNESIDSKFEAYIELIIFLDVGEGFHEFDPLIKQALNFAKQNSFQTHKDYPLLLKTNIETPFWDSYDRTKIDLVLLNELKQIDNGNHPQYAKTLLNIYSYHYEDVSLESLLIAKNIFENHKMLNYLNQSKTALVDYYQETNDFDKAETLLLELFEDDKFFNVVLISEHYFKRNKYVKAFQFCEIQLSKYDTQDNSLTEMDFDSCAWYALFAKQYDDSKSYFEKAANIQKKNMSLIYSTYEDLGQTEIAGQINQAYQFQKNLDLMALNWSKGDLTLAKKYLSELKLIDKSSEIIDLNNKIEKLKQLSGNAKSMFEKKNLLIIEAFTQLSH